MTNLHPDVMLRATTPADMDTILHHRREMFREMGGRYAELLHQFEAASKSYLQVAFAAGTYHGIFAEKNSEVIAGGGVVIADWPGSPQNLEPKRAWILNIYVEPGQRRRGLARLIVQTLIEWCRDNGFQSVALHASEHGRALYEKLGFRTTNEMRLPLTSRTARS